MSVSDYFSTFCSNIRMSNIDVEKIRNRYHQITKRINQDYWGNYSETSHSLYVGSYGRDTEVYTSDIDMLIELPYSTYLKFNNYSYNGQSSLLQDVKNSIYKTYSSSALKGDGQIISIPFYDNINFEILPAFLNDDKLSYTYPDSNNGGRWRITNPRAEINAIKQMNNKCNNNLKNLCRMMRCWKSENNVEISGILIDTLAYRFMSDWSYKDKSFLYYDFMSRDFFEYLKNTDKKQNAWQVMGSNRYIYNYGNFQWKATVAYNKCLEAISKEGKGYSYTAKSIWREIYGTKFPS